MNESKIQEALTEVLVKYGRTDYKGRQIASIALHRISEYNLTNAETLVNLPYASDNNGIVKYDVRKVDQVTNLQVWA